MQVRRPFFISLVDIVFEKILSKKKNVCFSIPSPHFFFNTRYVSPQYNISEQLLLETSKRTGHTLSLSVQIRLVP